MHSFREVRSDVRVLSEAGGTMGESLHRPPFLGIDKQRLEINLDGIEIQLVQRNCRK